MAKQALGKGLGALIGKQGGAAKRPAPAPAADAAGNDGHEQVELVPLDRVVASPLQPRKHFRGEQLTELMESIREHGIIQPLIVREIDGKLELIAGERRWRAGQELGISDVPVIRRKASDRDVLEMALIENLQREDLNPIEEARAYTRLAREFNLRQEDIAKRVGKNRATIANAMRLLDLDGEVQNLLAQGLISSGHAKVILSIKDHEGQRLIADQVVRGKLSVRATEKIVARWNSETDGRKTAKSNNQQGSGNALDPELRHVERRLQQRFATHVVVHHGAKRGKIEIEYYGQDDLQRVLELLGVDEDAGEV